MKRGLDEGIRLRAGYQCEYCRLPQSISPLPFPIDHIIAQQHGGQTISENLALCCVRCNRYKGPNVAGIDPNSGILSPLFHPRRDRWEDHFRWKGTLLMGITAIGRTTIAVLNINHHSNVEVRRELGQKS